MSSVRLAQAKSNFIRHQAVVVTEASADQHFQHHSLIYDDVVSSIIQYRLVLQLNLKKKTFQIHFRDSSNRHEEFQAKCAIPFMESHVKVIFFFILCVCHSRGTSMPFPVSSLFETTSEVPEHCLPILLLYSLHKIINRPLHLKGVQMLLFASSFFVQYSLELFAVSSLISYHCQ